jgi:UDP-N-acetyl-D-galactosamine dehydrogenase
MGIFVANKVIKMLIKKGNKIEGARALILGITFKENCPDIRNSRVIDIYRELESFGLSVDVYDPHADPIIIKQEYGIDVLEQLQGQYSTVILAVAHEVFRLIDFVSLKEGKGTVLFDTKAFLDRNIVDGRL